MDPKELRGLYEAYSEVYAPQEIDEAEKPFPHEKVKAKQVALRDKGGNALDRRMKMGMAVRRAKEAEKTGGSQRDAGKGWYHAKEELEIFDIVLEFLQVEGYVDTLEEAEWVMANLIDEEAIDIILDEDSRRTSNKQHTARVRSNIKAFGSNYTPPRNYDPDANRGQGEVLTRKQIEKKRRKSLRQEEFELWVNALVEEGYDLSDYTWDDMYEFYLDEAEKPFPHEKVKAKQVALRDKGANALDRRMKMGMAVRRAKEAEKTGGSQRDAGKGWYHAKEEFEAWIDEAMTNYEKNRKRAAQRAAARNDARAQGKTGAVPGVGYVTPRRERETWTDESGKTRHAKGL